MSYLQITDILAQLIDSLAEIRRATQSAMLTSHDSRTRKMLTAIEAEHGQIQIGLTEYRRDGDPGVLGTWMQFVPNEELNRIVLVTEFAPEMDADEVVARKQAFDRELIEFYEHIANCSNNSGVVDLFSQLRLEAETRAANQGWFVREFQPDGDPPETEDSASSKRST